MNNNPVIRLFSGAAAGLAKMLGGAALLAFGVATSYAATIDATGTQLWVDQLVTKTHTGYAEGFNAKKPIERQGSGGLWHVSFANTTGQPLTAENLTLGGVPFSELKRKFKAVWWRTQPSVIAPGQAGMLMLRWRSKPLAGEVEVSFRGGHTLKATLPKEPAALPFRLVSSSFDPETRELLLYWQSNEGEPSPLAKLSLDGKSVLEMEATGEAQWISRNFDHGLAVAQVRLPQGHSRADYLHVVATDEKGADSFFTIRLGDRFYPIGTYDMPGQVRIPELVEAGANTVAAHAHFSSSELVQLHSVGLQALQYTQLEGPTDLQIRSDAIETLITADEPDVMDWAFWGKPENAPAPPFDFQAGEYGQAVVEEALRIKEAKPALQTAVLVNLTIRPWNWYEYGQTCDLFISDNYVLTHGDPIDFITTVQRETLSAAAPFPVWHVYDNSYQEEKGRGINRPKTASEIRRIMQLAIGSGAKGMVGWWNVDFKESEARTYHATRNYPDQWAAQSQVWRELGLLSPLLAKAYPWDGIQRRQGVQLDALLAGGEALILSAVNMQVDYSPTQSKVRPIKDLVIDCALPAWMQPKHAWRIKRGGGFQPVNFSIQNGKLSLPAGELQDTALFLLATNENLAANLAARQERSQQETANKLLALQRSLVDEAGEVAALLYDLRLNRSSNLLDGRLAVHTKGGVYQHVDSYPSPEAKQPNALDWYEKPASQTSMGAEWDLGNIPAGKSTFAVMGNGWGGAIHPVLTTDGGGGEKDARILSSTQVGGVWLIEIESPSAQTGRLGMIQAGGAEAERGGQFAKFAWYLPGLGRADLIQNLDRR